MIPVITGKEMLDDAQDAEKAPRMWEFQQKNSTEFTQNTYVNTSTPAGVVPLCSAT